MAALAAMGIARSWLFAARPRPRRSPQLHGIWLLAAPSMRERFRKEIRNLTGKEQARHRCVHQQV